jgi:hypothetical protein
MLKVSQLSIDFEVTNKQHTKPGDRLKSQQTNKERLKDFSQFCVSFLGVHSIVSMQIEIEFASVKMKMRMFCD